MKSTNRKEIIAFIGSEAFSGVVIALVVITLLVLTSWAHGGDCRQVQRVVKQKARTAFVPVNYGYRNALVEIPVDAVISEIYDLKYALPVRTYEPVEYQPAPDGNGLQQPKLIQRVIETYSDEEAVETEQVVTEEEPEHCASPVAGVCEATTKPGSATRPHPGLAVAKENCASCHTGQKAKAANRPVFFDNAGKFIATDKQKAKMLTAARAGTMPPQPAEPLEDDEYLALSAWLNPKAKAEVKKPSDIEARLQRLEEENATLKESLSKKPTVSIERSPWSGWGKPKPTLYGPAPAPEIASTKE